MENTDEFSGNTIQENEPVCRKKEKTERAMGVGKRAREEIVKWNQMTALRFQTGERHQTPPGLPSRTELAQLN